jgi:hypothetical protein
MSGERIPLLPVHNSSKVHPGVGASRIPVRPSTGVGFAAGHHFGIAEGHLGVAAGHNSHTGSLSNGFPVTRPPQAVRRPQPDHPTASAHSTGKSDTLKPGDRGFKWNKRQRERYPEEWKRFSKAKKANNSNSGLTLPGSNNIGPGNSIGEALTNADRIAQGHDLHYSEPGNVQEADKEAISHFVHEAINGGNPISQVQAALGAVGLGVKHVAEHIYGGTIYGKGKQWLNHLAHHLMSERIGVE